MKRLFHAKARKVLAGLSASLVGIFLLMGGSHAINTILEGYRADSNTTTTIDATAIGGDCKKVVTPNDGKNHFIPTKTLAEWNGFKGVAAGLGITLNSCTYTIGKSLLFDGASGQYLSRTFGTPTDGKKWTLSFWVKRSKLYATNNIQFILATEGAGAQGVVGFGMANNGDELGFAYGGYFRRYTKMLFRDPAAWNHVVLKFDSTNSTEADRAVFYVDGTRVETVTPTTVSLNDTTQINQAVSTLIGNQTGQPYGRLDAYLSDVHFIDGQALAANAFGQIDDTTGRWKPAAYAGTYGVNGFHLAFNNDLSIGEDSASIDGTHTAANHWTPNNFILANGTAVANGTWTVPAGVTSLTASIWGSGGGGGAGGSNGGGGGFSRATIAVTPGETLEMRVGSVGTNGAGIGGGSAGNGGGYTGIFRGAPSQANALIIAGGGGGGGPVVSWTHEGGGGGGTAGQAGQWGSPGQGGTQTAGGANGGANGSPTNGSALAGGGGGAPEGYYGGAGGGAGYYGWGGGAQGQTNGGGAGGGGAGYVTGTNMSMVMATSNVVANNSDTLYVSGYGNAGQGGLIQLSYGDAPPSLVLDSPSNNFATMNPLDWGGGFPTFAKGNLKITGNAATHQYVRSTLAFPKTGKWYWEVQTNTTASAYSVHSLGIATTTGKPEAATKQSAIYLNNYGQPANQNNLSFAGGGSTMFQTVNATYVQSADDILRFAFDADTNKFWIGVNNNWFRADGNFGADPSAGANPTETLPSGHEWTPITEPFDAQSETFIFGAGGQWNLTYYPDAGGNFRYAPPTGFKSLSTANFPPPDIPNPKLHFDTLTWTGNGSYLSPVGNLATNPSPGYDVGKSLLFNSSQGQYLSRTFGAPTDGKKWTWSGWVKRGNNPNSADIFNAGQAGNNDAYLRFNGTSGITFGTYNGPGTDHGINTNATFLDRSAWYHIVVVFDVANATPTERGIIYVNGVRQSVYVTANGIWPQNYAASSFNTAVAHSIASDYQRYANLYFDGYMADTHFVDGQALSPADFGQTDSVTGKWAPKAYAGTYGANGFRLNFGNSSSIGEDSAPLEGSHPAANNWTANNFWNLSAKTFLVDDGTKAGNVIYSARIVGNGTVNLTAFGGAGNIGGSVFTGISSLNGLISDWQTHTVKKNGVTLFTVTGGAVSNDGGAQTASQSRNADTITQNSVAVSDGDIITFHVGANNAVTQYYNYPNNPPNLAITAAGGALIANDDAIMVDTPTNNFAILNPLQKSSAVSLQKGNLYASIPGGNYQVYALASNFSVNSGKWYFEVKTENSFFAQPQFGVGELTRLHSAMTTALAGGSSPGGYTNGTIVHSAANFDRVFLDDGSSEANDGATYVPGDIMQIAFDATAKKVWFGRNGTWNNGSNPATNTGGYVFSSWNYLTPYFTFNADSANSFTVNFGQWGQSGLTNHPSAGGYFSHTPPAGFKALSSKNLTEPATFDPGLVWIKNRSSATNHVLYDTNRWTSLGLSSNNTNTETSYPNGLLSFTNGGFALGSDSTVNTLNNNYVAWNWKAGGIPVTNTDGTIQSKVSADPVAGFSVVEYRGNGTSGTVGHGLDSAPKMVIVRSRDSANWMTWHKDLAGNGYYLWLNGTSGQTDAGVSAWNSAAPTSSVFSLGNSSNTNGVANFIAYAFAEVPGYSKFGSYKGNGSGDGPFVYTGFKPALVLRKNITAGPSNWLIQDSRRPGDNRTGNNCGQPGNEGRNWYLSSDQPATESDCFYGIDILSNGFKIRTPEGAHNGTNHVIIYAVFADTGIIPVLAPNASPNVPTFVSATATNPAMLSATYSDPDNGDSGWTNYRLATSSAGCLDNSTTVSWGTSNQTTNNSATTWTSSSISAGTYYWCAQNDDGVLKSAWVGMGTVAVPNVTNIVISADTNNYNLFTAAGSPTVAKDIILTVNAWVKVGSSSATLPAMTVPAFPAGSNITIVNNGFILGAGGTGGYGGYKNGDASDLYVAHNGQAGGTALSLGYPVTIDNTAVGSIFGGGGGGGASGDDSCNSDYPYPGGGGQGSVGGAEWKLYFGSSTPTYTMAQYWCSSCPVYLDGSFSSQGLARYWGSYPGDYVIDANYGPAGDGGTWGQPGGNSPWYDGSGCGGVAGSGGAWGLAISKNGNTVTWTAGNNATQVKWNVQ